ncbi:hypothetical protein CEXT_161791 [Caerostris extrusa]|uniref:Uncharacterized protein n=1 Tax=Caerostris extrusa TaxID=172846 RepID=A0AAV4VUS8_CAEEX|nr:hypothetical protein CEXT_161791 [Caerostris extrusa]
MRRDPLQPSPGNLNKQFVCLKGGQAYTRPHSTHNRPVFSKSLSQGIFHSAAREEESGAKLQMQLRRWNNAALPGINNVDSLEDATQFNAPVESHWRPSTTLHPYRHTCTGMEERFLGGRWNFCRAGLSDRETHR